MAIADEIFIQNMNDIINNGTWDTDYPVRPHWADGTPAHTVKKFCIVNRYDLSKELPILTIRRTYFKSCLDELLWIWQKKSNNIHVAQSEKPTAISLPRNRFTQKANSIRSIESSMTSSTTHIPAAS